MIVRNLEAVFSFKYDPAKFKKATSSLDDFASKANLAIGAIAGSVALQALQNFMWRTPGTDSALGFLGMPIKRT